MEQNFFLKVKQQLNWSQEFKEILWQNIIKLKIENQKAVIGAIGKQIKFNENVLPGDKTNVEGRFAKEYFSRLFGSDFKRQIYPYEINAGLNYGYTILLSKMARIISGHGYLLQVGIHHIGENNPYNLACDFVEPFRPIVDKIVYKNKEKTLNKEYKKQLLMCIYNEILYKGNKCSVAGAMERLFIDGISSLNGDIKLGEIVF